MVFFCVRRIIEIHAHADSATQVRLASLVYWRFVVEKAISELSLRPHLGLRRCIRI